MTKSTAGVVDLQGRIAIVTGAGSGIGRAIALTLASAGAIVVVSDIALDRVEETAGLIKKQGGTAGEAVADISDESACNEMVDKVASRWGRIDILCNNAGIMDHMDPPVETATATWNRVLAVDLTAPFFMTRAVLPHMLARKSGAIVNTASIAGLRGGSAGLAYTAAKHGLVGLTRHVAWVHGPDGIRCNAFCPGPTETNIDNGQGLAAFNQKGLARITPVISLADRMTGPQVMADLVLFLVSDAAAYINGTIIPVDGGWMAG